MKITKEEKQLYKLLDVVNKIFGKTSDRTIICGSNNKLYFYTLGYCGVFVSKDNDETFVDAYDFGTYFYELKQLPNKSFVLDVQNYGVTTETQNLYYNVLNFIDSRIEKKEWLLEMYKDYDHKIAKIATSGKWIRDEDISYLKIFNELEVFNCDDSLIFRGQDESCDVFLIMNGSIVIPDYDDSTQMKINVYLDNPHPSVEENPEEIENEESFDDDPMA